ncbi:MAG: hypothetical protein IPO62_17965 [Saprospiraceae bacterium]|nr:hypothetical protein [Saprospiraceae bacterium]
MLKREIKLNDDLNNYNNYLKTDKIEGYAVINCNSANCYTLPSECYCYLSTCCSRQDLDPCDYADGEAFAQAVACELNKIANGCTQQGYQPGCEGQSWSICLDLGSVPAYVPDELTDIVDDANPFQFCSDASCDSYECSSGGFEEHHFIMTIAYQNAMLSWLRGVGAGIFSCGIGSRVAGLRMSFGLYCPGGECDDTNKTTNCHNIRLVVRFHDYFCCPL